MKLKFSVHLLYVCLLLVFVDVDAENADYKSIKDDVTEVSYRHPSEEQMESYKNMEVYDYDEVVRTESWWSRFLRWLAMYLSDVGLNPVITYYILTGIGVLLIVFYLLKMYGIKPIELLFFKQDKEIGELLFSQQSEDLYRQNLEELLGTCIRNKAYREAIRILYLSAVKNMDQSGLIEWQTWKTDRDYCYELSDREIAIKFKKLVRNYEYIWYGQFIVNEEEFYTVKQEFDGFGNLITASNAEK